MIRRFLPAVALLALAPAAAQAQAQAELDVRHQRALAAGYKAVMLCSAIANAERAGGSRSTESVEAWELAGIQQPLDAIIPTLDYRIDRLPDEEGSATGRMLRVAVAWEAEMPPRLATHHYPDGCVLQPIGSVQSAVDPGEPPKNPPTSRIDWTASAAPVPGFPDAFSARYGADARTTGVVVLQDARSVFEAYAPDFGPDVPQRTWSVAKSIAATLVGAAVLREGIEVTAPAAVAAWQGPGDPRAAISLDNLLRMASGRYSDTAGNRTDPIYWGGALVDERAASWPLIHPPGTVFRYANNDTLMAIEAISPTFVRDPPSDFFRKLGMQDTVAETDWRGDFILSSQVWSTARDLAVLGQLYLDDGIRDGERLLPEGWVNYVSSPAGPQPGGAFGYGAGFWLLNASKGVPPDTFAAFGNRGQYVVIVPSRRAVIVRRGEDPAGGKGFDIAAFTRDVLASLNASVH